MVDVCALHRPLEQELGVKRKPGVGKAHGLVDFAEYEAHQRHQLRAQPR